MVGFKNRYMVMEVFIDPNKDFSVEDPIILTEHNVKRAITGSILSNFGECGSASSTYSFQVKYVNQITKICILRASRDEYQKVWISCTMVRSIGNCPAVFNLLDLSGSIKPCRTAALKCEEQKFEQFKLDAGARVTNDHHQEMAKSLEKIKLMEH